MFLEISYSVKISIVEIQIVEFLIIKFLNENFDGQRCLVQLIGLDHVDFCLYFDFTDDDDKSAVERELILIAQELQE